jgi:hypothetical protein
MRTAAITPISKVASSLFLCRTLWGIELAIQFLIQKRALIFLRVNDRAIHSRCAYVRAPARNWTVFHKKAPRGLILKWPRADYAIYVDWLDMTTTTELLSGANRLPSFLALRDRARTLAAVLS